MTITVKKGTGVDGFSTPDEIFQNAAVFQEIKNMSNKYIFLTPQTVMGQD
jgi:hypothetical protein